MCITDALFGSLHARVMRTVQWVFQDSFLSFIFFKALKDRPLVPRLGLGSLSWWNQFWF